MQAVPAQPVIDAAGGAASGVESIVMSLGGALGQLGAKLGYSGSAATFVLVAGILLIILLMKFRMVAVYLVVAWIAVVILRGFGALP